MKCKTILSLVCSASLVLAGVIGCGGSSSPPVANNGGEGDRTYDLTLTAEYHELEVGESTDFVVSLVDGSGRKLEDAPLDFTTYDANNPSTSLGIVTPTQTLSDTLSSYGTDTQVRFQSQNLGTAVVKAIYDDDAGNVYDSSMVTIPVVSSLHTLILSVVNNRTTPVVGEEITFHVTMYRGDNQSNEWSGGKAVEFSAYRVANPSADFGSFRGGNMALTAGTETDSDGLNRVVGFTGDAAGAAWIKIIYRNGLGIIAASDSVMITVQ